MFPRTRSAYENKKIKKENFKILKILWSVRNFNWDKFLSKTTRNFFQVYILKTFLSNIFLIAKASTMTLSFPNILISNIRQISKISSYPTFLYHFGCTILNSIRIYWIPKLKNRMSMKICDNPSSWMFKLNILFTLIFKDKIKNE